MNLNQRKSRNRTTHGPRRGIALVLAIAAVFVIGMTAAPAVLAQKADDPGSAQYTPPIPQEGTGSSSASGDSDPSGLDSPIGSLPFTGLDLLIILAVAVLLTGTGLALRRLSAPPGPRP